MANINVRRLSLQPTAVVEVDMARLPDPPNEILRLPGFRSWWDDMQLSRQRDRETIRRLVLTKATATTTETTTGTGEQGPEGPEGPQGLQGPPGPKGDKGDPGVSGANVFQILYLKNVDTGNYCPLTIIGTPPAQQWNFGDPEDPNPPIKYDVIYILNQDTGLYCPVTIIGIPPAQQFNFGSPEIAP